MSEQVVVKIRPAIEADSAFIFNSWLQSNRNQGFARNVNSATYFAEQHKLIEGLLKTAKTFVATDPEDPSTIYAWVCYERIEGILTIHYAYTKQPFRRLGLQVELLKEAAHDWTTASICTHFNYKLVNLFDKRNIMYHPYILTNYKKA